MQNKHECPICHSPSCVLRSADGHKSEYLCDNCGQFILSGTFDTILPKKTSDPVKAAILSHAVWKMQRADDVPKLSESIVCGILKRGSVLSPIEQAERAVLLIGDNFHECPGTWFQASYDNVRAKIGAVNVAGASYAWSLLVSCGWIQTSQAEGASARLNAKGWEKYEELKRGVGVSRSAFMAMPFESPIVDLDLDKVYSECFQPAVKATGFELRRVDEAPRAGLIDDQIRTDIRTSRFLIAELTGDNRGAYWEAGFAEGLGKPVIYTCEKGYVSETHFDTNHHLTVEWEESDLEQAAKKLKTVIRATLPEDARMTDESGD